MNLVKLNRKSQFTSFFFLHLHFLIHLQALATLSPNFLPPSTIATSGVVGAASNMTTIERPTLSVIFVVGIPFLNFVVADQIGSNGDGVANLKVDYHRSRPWTSCCHWSHGCKLEV